MNVGSMSILFREQLGTQEHISYTESMRRIRAAGFESVDLNLCQLCAFKTDLHRDDWEKYAQEMKRTADELGLRLPQCHLPFRSGKVKWKTPEEWDFYCKMVYRAIDVAVYMGFPWAVLHAEPMREKDLTKQQKAAANHDLNDPFIEYALKKGLNIALENVRSTKKGPLVDYCSEAEDLAELIDSYHDERVGACWDTGHANATYTDQWEPLHVIGKRLRCTHIDDNRGTDDLHLLPFDGTVKWDRVMGALRDIGYPGDLILEVYANLYTPNDMKDETARHAFYRASCLMNL